MTTTHTPGTTTAAAGAVAQSRSGYWTGPTRQYDLLKEGTIALVVVGLLTAILAALFSSPDQPAISLQRWAHNQPDDFVATTVHELAGDTTSAGYGAPYNNGGGEQSLGPVSIQKLAGVTHPVDSAHDFVIAPLAAQTTDKPLQVALKQWTTATPDQQAAWTTHYLDALDKAGTATKVGKGDYGPVPAIAARELDLALSGGLDSAMVSKSPFYPVNTTKATLFLADGTYLDTLAGAQHLHGDTWGMVNTVGNYPGQSWLWLVSLWYQLPAFTTPDTYLSANADLTILALTGALSMIFIFLPFLPGLRSVPAQVPVYRIIWRHWYRHH